MPAQKDFNVLIAGIDHVGPAGIYRAADPLPAVSLATFTARFRRLVKRNVLSPASSNDSLWLNPDDFRRKYGTRRTLVEIDGKKIDLLAFYEAESTETAVDYGNFWRRVRTLNKKEKLTGDSLADALNLRADSWKSYYGGGRRQAFIYEGELFPEHDGKRFHSVTAFLRTVGRYDDRALIWSRMKAGWSLDDALAVPIAFGSHRSGLIYRITRRKTGAVYVGLTVMWADQRWFFHVRAAFAGGTSKLHSAIREDGPDGFDVEVLEEGITDIALLSARETFWVGRFDALGANGLNTAKPGGLGSPRGKAITLSDENFRSIAEASDVLSDRLGIAGHVIRTRLLKGLPIPNADQVRRHSKHPDAGSNLFRRWLGMLKRHTRAVSDEWATNYDRFKADVSRVPEGMELVRKRPAEPWGPGNVEWVSTLTKVERIHGKSLMVNGVAYPSLKAVATAFDIGVSTLKYRIREKGVSVEEAISAPLGSTSYKQSGKPIMVDGQMFRSKNQAILYIAETRGITEHQAKYRFSTGKY